MVGMAIAGAWPLGVAARRATAASRHRGVRQGVAMRCCASTTRQGCATRRARLELPADCVQILDDIHEPLGRPDALGRDAAEMTIERGEPCSGFRFVAAGDRVEAAEQANEEQGQRRFGRARPERAVASQPRHRGFARAKDDREISPLPARVVISVPKQVDEAR